MRTVITSVTIAETGAVAVEKVTEMKAMVEGGVYDRLLICRLAAKCEHRY